MGKLGLYLKRSKRIDFKGQYPTWSVGYFLQILDNSTIILLLLTIVILLKR